MFDGKKVLVLCMLSASETQRYMRVKKSGGRKITKEIWSSGIKAVAAPSLEAFAKARGADFFGMFKAVKNVWPAPSARGDFEVL
ncbi:MAG: hypothetical protein K2X68_03710 [Novosphingobium sp.]|nr:hypothetical protein [Novosphingobium sp.]